MPGTRKLTIEILGDSKGVAGAFKDAGDSADGFGAKLGGAAKLAGAAMLGIGAGAVAMAPAILSTGASLEALGKKSATVFEGSLADVQAWSDANAAAMGLTSRQATGLAAGIGDLLKPMGFTAEQAAGMSTKMLDLSGALSAWTGGQKSAAEVSDIITKAMLGERDGLKDLGISISEADVQARLAANGTDKLTGAALEQAKAVATQQLIVEKSTDAQKAWADGSMDAIKAQNKSKASLDQLKETLVTAIYPALQAVVPIVTEVAQWLGERLPGAIEVVKSWLVDNLGPAVQWIGDRFGELVVWVRAHWDQISATVAQAVGYIEGAISTATAAIQAIWSTWGDNILAYVRITWDAISGVVAAALDVIKGIVNVVMGIIHGDFSQVWDGIKGIFGGVWDAITTIVRTALAQVGNVISAAWNGVKAVTGVVWDAVKGAVMAPINAVRDGIGAVVDGIAGAVTGTWDRIKSVTSTVWDGIKSAVSTGINDIVGFVAGLPGNVKSAVGNAFSSIWDSFKGVINKVISAWNNLGFSLPKILFDWNGPLPGGDVDVGGWTISTPNLPLLAKGGVLTGPTVFVGGEYAGAMSNPEIVTPESLMRQVMADTLAGWMPDRLGGQVVVNVYPQGHVVTDAALVDMIHEGLLQKARRSGALQL